eukprot:GHVL01037015.1.p1 GENE.GHVL01037015.1~~GHVL01037015.1.p1  ORF type:complete len:283 (+),score=49.92 GHVL01037015.1:300-1148(+)
MNEKNDEQQHTKDETERQMIAQRSKTINMEKDVKACRFELEKTDDVISKLAAEIDSKESRLRALVESDPFLGSLVDSRCFTEPKLTIRVDKSFSPTIFENENQSELKTETSIKSNTIKKHQSIALPLEIQKVIHDCGLTSEFINFYESIFALLWGCSIMRDASKKESNEIRCLRLSRDFKRLEIWSDAKTVAETSWRSAAISRIHTPLATEELINSSHSQDDDKYYNFEVWLTDGNRYSLTTKTLSDYLLCTKGLKALAGNKNKFVEFRSSYQRAINKLAEK